MKQTNLSNTIYAIQNDYAAVMTRAEAEESFKLFRFFLLDHCREGSRTYNQICTVDPDLIQDVGLFKRLTIENGKVHYIAGQDSPEEIKLLKKYFVKVAR